MSISEKNHEGIPVAMAEEFELKNVGMVALTIGVVVLALGLVGLLVILS